VNASPAPFDHASAEAPEDAHAVWAFAADGVRLRLGHLGKGDCGTVLAVPGRTEYLEKYGNAAAEFAARGYGLIAADYRGQGLADRLYHDPVIGHVDRFADYQLDVAALVAFAEERQAPKPWFLLGHSLGGAIGLRALIDGLPVKAAVFSAPMWGINMAPILRPVAWGLGWAADRLSLNWWVTPGMSRVTYVREADPADNFLTTDPRMLDYMRRQLDAVPGLDLGGPSVPWLYRALVEARDLRRNALPRVPTLTICPSGEEIVCKKAMRDLTGRWPHAELLVIEGGKHETMMETPERRQLFYDTAAAFFASHTDRRAA